MSNLEDIVPPLELCRKIPKGCFADSALIFDGYGIVYERFGRIAKTMMYGMQTYPAPTLQEILDALTRMELCPSLGAIFPVTGNVVYSICAGGGI